MTVALNIDLPSGFQVSVATTHKRGFTPEEVASRCVNKIVSVSDTAHPALRDQAREYKSAVESVVSHYIREAIASDRTTVYNALADVGHPELAELIRRL
jgi:hypothetical protein